MAKDARDYTQILSTGALSTLHTLGETMSKWNELIAAQKAERIDLVQKALDKHKTKTNAANSLGITRQQLYQFMRQHKLQIVARQ